MTNSLIWLPLVLAGPCRQCRATLDVTLPATAAGYIPGPTVSNSTPSLHNLDPVEASIPVRLIDRTALSVT